MNKIKGFTLIELLVVITIMGILATGGITVYTTQMQKARDSNRITDVTSLQSAVEQFNQDKAKYPLTKDDWTGSGASIISYMPNLAQDPRFNATVPNNCNGTTCMYVYTVKDTISGISQGSYEISTGFENTGNVEGKAVKAADGGDDDVRLEKGYEIDSKTTPKPGCDTTVAINIGVKDGIGGTKGQKIAIFRNTSGQATVGALNAQ